MRLKLLFFLFASLLVARPALGIELQPYAGMMTYDRLSGCCEATGTNAGFGILARVDTEPLGVWDVNAYTDKSWSEFNLMRPWFLMGRYDARDPSQDKNIEVSRMSKWQFAVSYGLGYFVHSTRTEQYSLAARVSGVSVATQSQLRYTIRQDLSAVGILHLGAGLAADDKGFLWGAFLGVNYRPK